MNKKIKRREVRWDALFQVVWIYERSAMVVRIMIMVATALPRETVDQVMSGPRLDRYWTN